MYEFKLYIEDYKFKEEKKAKELVTLAYYTDGFRRMKKLPKLDKLLEGEKQKAKTPKDMFEEIKKLNAMLGGEVIGGS